MTKRVDHLDTVPEQSCLKLVFSVLIRASKRGQRVTMENVELKQMDALREQLLA